VKARQASGWRRRLFDVHSAAGLALGLVLAVVCLSGAAAVFRREIDWLTTPSLRVASYAGPLRWQAAWSSAQATTTDGVWSLRRPEGARFAWVADVRGAAGATEVMVDPSTSRVTGARVLGYHRGAVAHTLRQLHVRLWMGPWGRALVGLCGALMVLLGGAGYLLLRRAPRGPVQGRRAWSRAHGVVGRWTLWFHAVTGVTGAVLGLEVVPPLLSAPTGMGAKSVMADPAASAQWRTSLDAAVARAEAALPGAVARSVRVGDGAVSVFLDHASPWTARGASEVAVSMQDGALLGVWDARREAPARRVYDALDPLHFGYFGEAWGSAVGVGIRLVWCFLGTTPAVLAVSGAVLWRRRARRRGVEPWAPARPVGVSSIA
jgi:uncharacterized iron-regulated membrane protein